MRGFLEELGYPQLGPTVIYVDNTAAITLSEKFNLSNNSAHLVTKLNYIHQEIMNGSVKLQYINTENQIADILTKGSFTAEAWNVLCKLCVILPASSCKTTAANVTKQ